MKLHCHRPSLVTALSIVGSVVPSRTTRDILKNVKLQVSDGSAMLIGTDQEVGIRYQIEGVETSSAGETLLPTARVNSILRELNDDTIEIEVDEQDLWIRAGHSEFRLLAADPAEFPDVAEFADDNYLVVAGNVLGEAIRRTVFATDVESTRYALGGVLWEAGSDVLALVATDTRRLSLVKIPSRVEGELNQENPTPVIPRTAMALIEKSLDDDEEVKVALGTNEVLISCGRATIYSRLVEGRFPRYADVIPKDSTHQVEIVVGPVYSAVRQSQIVTNEDSRGVDFRFHEGTLTLESSAADIGVSKIDLPISFDGDEFAIKFDPRYLGEFFRVLPAETQVSWHLIDEESPAVFRTEDEYTYVIMPLARDAR